MKRAFALILFMGMFCLWLVSVSHAAPDRGVVPVPIKNKGGKQVLLYKESHALVIGVSEYTNGWPRLPGVMDDLREITKTLESQGFNVVVVRNPTRETLIKSFDDFINKYGTGKDNRLLFYFAGHGYTAKLEYGGDMGYIVPADAPDPNRDLNGFLSKAMDMEMFTVYAKRVRAKHALFLFDSCFSGSLFALSRAIPEDIQEKTSKPVRQFITAGTAEQTVPDRSLFRDQLVRALSGEADGNHDGYVTGTELGQFLEDSVTNYSHRSQTPKYGKISDPNLDKGDFVFSMKPVRKPADVEQEKQNIIKERSELEEKRKSLEAEKQLTEERRKLEEERKRVAKLEKSKADTYIDMEKKAHAKAIESRHPDYRNYLDSVDKSGRLVEGKLNKWISTHSLSSKWQKISKEGTADEVNHMFYTFKRENGIEMSEIDPYAEAFKVKIKTDTQKKQTELKDVATDKTKHKKYATLEELPPPQERDESTPAEMVKIPGGSFYAGFQGESDNKPRTLEIVTFSIDKYEVTQAEYEKVMRQNPSYFKGSNLPVESVTWYEANDYCRKVGKRLPTEWEWEFAAKGGMNTMYTWGDTMESGKANFCDRNCDFDWKAGQFDDGNKNTAPVGSYPPNGYGLYDMAGNVWEWTVSYWGNSGNNKVFRGGSWNDIPNTVRSASRNFLEPGTHSDSLGFRCAQ